MNEELTNRGFELQREKRYDESLVMFEQALSEDAGHADAYVGRARVRMHHGEYEAALVDLDSAIRLDPEDSGAYGSRSTVHYLLDNVEACLSDSEMAIRLKPSAVLYSNHAYFLNEFERYEEALEAVERAIELEGDPNPYLSKRAKLRFQLGDFEGACQDFEADPNRDDDDLLTLVRRVGCLRYLDREPEAVALLLEGERLIDDDEETRAFFAKFWFEWGEQCHEAQDYVEAAHHLRRAMELGRRDARAHSLLGDSLYGKGDHAESIPFYDEAIRLDPENARRYVDRAWARYQVGDNDGVFTDADKARELGHDSDELYHMLGLTYVDMKKFEEAEREFTLAIEREASVDHFYWRGASRDRLGNQAGAVEDYRETVRLDPEHADAFELLGMALYDLERYEDAADAFDEAVRLGNESVDLFKYRNMNWIRLGQTDFALDESERVLLLDPDDVHTIFFHGVALFRQGFHEEALPFLTEANQRAEKPFAFGSMCQGHIYEAWGELEESVRLHSEAIEAEPSAIYYEARGQVLESLEEFEACLADFDEAVRLEPDNAHRYYERSRIHDYLGHDELAEADLRTAEDIELRAEHDEQDEEDEPVDTNRFLIYTSVIEHFPDTPRDKIELSDRAFPDRCAPDLQLALDEFMKERATSVTFFAPERSNQPVTELRDVWIKDRRYPIVPGSPKYEEFDIGTETPVRFLVNGLWLLTIGETPCLIAVTATCDRGIVFQTAIREEDEPTGVLHEFFEHLERFVRESPCYRGKVLSLEHRENYSGLSQGFLVHKLRDVAREEVILPSETLDLLDRNTLDFIAHRPQLAEFGLSIKKGVLFYGPPGVGKTHTLHYLSRALPEHTTFLITAEQVGFLEEYVNLARLFQPSMVVLEDVDLIARHRGSMHSPSEEVMLNKLLNEMDGLREDAEILFVLTTNRAEALEEALTARPGRIDQAIEFPFPDTECRERLVRLYSKKFGLGDDLVSEISKRTEGVSASFIKELIRRATQFHLQKSEEKTLDLEDIERALDELLVSGGSLNRKLLGAGTSLASRKLEGFTTPDEA